MKLLLQILFFFLTWFTNLAIATPVFIKVVLSNYELTLVKIENVKEESVVKICVVKDNTFDFQIFQNTTSQEQTVLLRMACAGDVKSIAKGADWLSLESKLVAKLSSSIDATTLNKMITQMKNAGDEGISLDS